MAYFTPKIPEGMENLPVSEVVKDLEILIPELNFKDQNFARSLCDWYKAGKFYSYKQLPWVYILLQRAMTPKPADHQPHTVVEPTISATNVTATPTINFEGINKLFLKAAEHLKMPSIIMEVEGIGSVKIAKFSAKAKYAGSIGIWLNKAFMGHLNSANEFKAAYTFSYLSSKKEALMGLLTEFSTDPAGVAAKYGKLASRCVFCRKPLDDPKSLAVGYGPVCAAHYHLPWGQEKLSLESIAA